MDIEQSHPNSSARSRPSSSVSKATTNNAGSSSSSSSSKMTNLEREKENNANSMQCRVYKALEELRQGGYFCDAVIRCGNQTFKVQRNILATCSPYFTALFTYESSGERPKRNKVTKEFFIPDMAPDVMEMLIKYAYTRDLPLDPSTIIQLLPAADRFQMEGLLKSCCQALLKEMTLDNCLHIRAFARAFTYSCRELTEAAEKFLLENFTWLYNYSPEFLQMDCDDLCSILANDKLNVRSEATALDAVCRWVAYDYENRYPEQSEKLLREVRMGLLTNDAFFRILNFYKLTAACPTIHAVLLNASRLMATPEILASSNQCTPRLPSDLLFVFGGSHLGWPLQIVQAFDIRSRTWKECSSLEFGPRSYHGTAAVEHVVYVIGGFDGTDYTNYCTAFHVISGIWTQVAPMHDKRCYVSVAVHDGYVYALGGFDGRIRQRSAERYHPPSNQWSMIQPMLCPRSDGGATALKDKIYVMGGFNGQESLNSVEYYDPASNQWTMIRPMRERRSGVGVAAHGNMVYSAGGFNGTRRLSSVESYDPESDDWKSLCPMLNARSNFAMTVIEDQLMVIGGYGGRHTTARVETYDVCSDRWSVSTELSYSRSALTACVVSGLPNVGFFTCRRATDADQTAMVRIIQNNQDDL